MRQLVFVFVFLLACAGESVAQIDRGNHVSNPNFASGANGWYFWQNTQLRPIDIVTPGFDPTPAAKITITEPGNNMQFFQRGIRLDGCSRHLVFFSARSSRGQDMAVFLHKDVADFHNLGLDNFVVDLTTSWQVFQVGIAAPGCGEINDARLRFWFTGYASQGDEYFIDNVCILPWAPVLFCPLTFSGEPPDKVALVGDIEEFHVVAEAVYTWPLTYQWQKKSPGQEAFVDIPGATSFSYSTPPVSLADDGTLFKCIVTPCPGMLSGVTREALLTVGVFPNTISNGGFESGTTPWIYFENTTNKNINIVSPGFSGNSAAKIVVGSAGSNIQLYQVFDSLEIGARYRLKFAAYSSSGHDLAVFMNKHGSPFTNYGLNGYVANLGTNWQEFSTEFVAQGFSGLGNDARIRFWLSSYAATNDVYYIDNVTLAKIGLGKETVKLPTLKPENFVLDQNYPNPFNPTTNIRFQIPEVTHVSLKVFDVLGREVATLVDEVRDAGVYEQVFDAGNLASGMYFYRLQAGSFSDMKKLLLLR